MINTQNNTYDAWQDKVINSSLWAAYGDALGFITELADEKGVKFRSGLNEVSTTVKWKRKIGGNYGASVQLPVGCYSDDTQLRLAVSRAIGHNGLFDVDSFAHIELPVWMNYQLGGGIGTNQAAKNLSKKTVGWATNFFQGKKSYTDGGGNGAAMRVQPHIWSLPVGQKSADLVKPILANSICTHGHPRALLGALFHGYCLYFSMIENEASKPDSWYKFLSDLKNIPELIRDDPMLGIAWLPSWEERAKIPFEKAWRETVDEMKRDIVRIDPMLKEKGPITYLKLVDALGCSQNKWRGTGTKTTLLASALVILSDSDPKRCAQLAANTLDSDTDTIGTMACAISGALCGYPPQDVVQDKDYLTQEAIKLSKIRFGHSADIFIYPPLDSWKAPTANVDAIYESNGDLYISGLGKLKKHGESYPDVKNVFMWQWTCTEFNQSLLIKRRQKPSSGIPIYGKYKTKDNFVGKTTSATQINQSKNTKTIQVDAIEQKLIEVKNNAYSPESIGRAILELSSKEMGIEKALAFTSLLVASFKKNF